MSLACFGLYVDSRWFKLLIHLLYSILVGHTAKPVVCCLVQWWDVYVSQISKVAMPGLTFRLCDVHIWPLHAMVDDIIYTVLTELKHFSSCFAVTRNLLD